MSYNRFEGILNNNQRENEISDHRIISREFWIDLKNYLAKNSNQYRAMILGLTTVINGGMHFSWGKLNRHENTIIRSNGDHYSIIVVWIITAIVGFFISAMFINARIPKKKIYVS